MYEQQCHPGVRVVVALMAHPPIRGTIVEVKPFYYRGQGARVVVQCDSVPGHALSNHCGEFRVEELKPAAG